MKDIITYPSLPACKVLLLLLSTLIFLFLSVFAYFESFFSVILLGFVEGVEVNTYVQPVTLN